MRLVLDAQIFFASSSHEQQHRQGEFFQVLCLQVRFFSYDIIVLLLADVQLDINYPTRPSKYAVGFTFQIWSDSDSLMLSYSEVDSKLQMEVNCKECTPIAMNLIKNRQNLLWMEWLLEKPVGF